MSGSTDRLIADLSRDLRPVSRGAALRVQVGAVLGLAAITATAALVLWDLRADLGARLAEALGFGAVLAGLVMLALGGVAGGLAGSVPGRENVLRAGLAVAVGGALLALGVGGFLLPADPGFSIRLTPRADLECLLSAAVLALPAAAAGLGFIADAWAARPRHAQALVAGGAVAAATVLVHLTCRADALPHVIVAHAAAPIVLGLLLGWVLPDLIERVRTQSASR